MWMMHSSVKIYLAAEPVDFGAGFNRLVAMVRSSFRHDASSGHQFVFLNRRATQTKMLFFDRTGYVIFHKRLEAGKFSLLRTVVDGVLVVKVDARELGLMLEGVVLRDCKQTRRWGKEMLV